MKPDSKKVQALFDQLVDFNVGLEAVRKIDPIQAECAARANSRGYLTGFAHSKKTGWVVLGCSEFEAFVVWQEKK